MGSPCMQHAQQMRDTRQPMARPNGRLPRAFFLSSLRVQQSRAVAQTQTHARTHAHTPTLPYPYPSLPPSLPLYLSLVFLGGKVERKGLPGVNRLLSHHDDSHPPSHSSQMNHICKQSHDCTVNRCALMAPVIGPFASSPRQRQFSASRKASMEKKLGLQAAGGGGGGWAKEAAYT